MAHCCFDDNLPIPYNWPIPYGPMESRIKGEFLRFVLVRLYLLLKNLKNALNFESRIKKTTILEARILIVYYQYSDAHRNCSFRCRSIFSFEDEKRRSTKTSVYSAGMMQRNAVTQR